MSYYLEKPKRKNDEFEGPLDSLLMFLGAKATPFEFTSAVSLENCAALLRAKELRRGFTDYLLNRPSINVELFRSDDVSYQFRITKKQGKHLPIVLTGHLERQSATSTLITGEARTRNIFWQMVIPFAVFTVIFLIFGLIREIPYPINLSLIVFMPFVLVLSLVSSAFDRRGFIRFVQGVVSHPADNLHISDAGLC